MDAISRFRGCLLGLAIGDAVGTTVEFIPRGRFAPVTDMLGGGPFHLYPGQWTDDTSMALCLGESLIEKGFDPRDQMDRYVRWMKDGYMSSTGKCFDIGQTVSRSLARYIRSDEPFSGSTHPNHAGNGSIMRLAPVPLYFFPDIEQAEHYASESSRTTHGAEECIDACRLFARMICRALAGMTKEEILHDDGRYTARIAEIAAGTYRDKSEDEIRGSGYVVESLEAALWSFFTTQSFESAILKAVNLGDDADTTAAVCGQIAGAFYGEGSIPEHWLDRLYMRDDIGRMAEELRRNNPA